METEVHSCFYGDRLMEDLASNDLAILFMLAMFLEFLAFLICQGEPLFRNTSKQILDELAKFLRRILALRVERKADR